MASIASLGVGSGLDLQSLVQRLVSSERAPTDNRLSRKESSLKTQVSAIGQLKSGLAKLDTALAKLSDLSDGRTVKVSDTASLTATADADAEAGTYSIEVLGLASAHALASDGFADPEASLGAGELTLALGANDPVTITLEEGADSLNDLRAAINAADAGVRATIVRDGDASRLLLSGAETGAGQLITLSPGAGVDARLDSAVMTQTKAAADASFSVDGLVLGSASNQVEDVLPGLSLTLKAETEAPLELTVSQDEKSARDALKGLVTAYNAVIDLSAKLSNFDPETGQGSILTGDATLRSIRGMLPAALGQAGAGKLNAIQMGLSSGLDGKISLDEETFNELMSGDPSTVLASLNGFGDALGENVRRYSASDGLLDSRSEGLKSSLSSIDDQRDALNLRMESYEARLQRQFGALDQLVAQLNTTSSFLDSQLSNLEDIAKGSR